MMVNARNALVQLGKIVASDMSSGRLGDAARIAAEALTALPDPGIGLIDLAVEEAGKKRPDEQRILAYLFLLGKALEMLRFGTERASPAAAEAVAAVRSRVAALARSGDTDPGFLMLVSRQFATAKLDVGSEIRTLIGAMVEAEGDSISDHPAGGAADFKTLSRQFGDDAFAIHSELCESIFGFPDEQKVAIVLGMATAPVAPVREAALGWLLDPSREVRVATARALAETAAEGLFTDATRRRLVLLRNWLPDEDHDAVDAAIEAAQPRAGDSPRESPGELRGVLASGFDGAGAQSIFAIAKTGRRHALACILLKQGFGVREAWVRRGLTKGDVGDFVAAVEREMGVYEVSIDYLRVALPHFLNVNRQSGVLPPFGALDTVELLRLDADPAAVSVEQITTRVIGANGPKRGSDVGRALAASADWSERHDMMETWFEDDATVDHVLAGKRSSKAKRADLVLDAIIAPRRGRWAELLAWTALVLKEAGERGDAVDFALVARELAADRPVSDIPLMRGVAAATVESWEARRR